MGSIHDPIEVGCGFCEVTPPSFDEFQKQTLLMTNCTLLWKELSDHFNSLEQDLRNKSESLKGKIENLDHHTKESLEYLNKRETTIDGSVDIAIMKVEQSKEALLIVLEKGVDASRDVGNGEVDDSGGLLTSLKEFCLKMDSRGFWKFVTVRKKEFDAMRVVMPVALAECVDPARFVLEMISEVFPVDKRVGKSGNVHDLGWACVLVLESLIPAVVDPVIGKSRLLVTPSVKERANEIAETWKANLDQRGGIENMKTPDVHTFLQHLVTFGIVKKEDIDLYRKLVVGSAWRKQMPKLAVSLGLGDKMADVIEELISRGQQLDAVHFTYEVGLLDRFSPVLLLKAYLKDAKKAASSIEDQGNPGRALQLAARKEQSALKAVIKCIEAYKLEAEFPPENLKKRLDQLERAKNERKKPVALPANKRTRASNGGPFPPSKAGRSTNAYVSSSFPSPPPAFIRSPSRGRYSAVAPYLYDVPAGPTVYGNRSPPTNLYGYSPEVAPLAGSYSPLNYPSYGGYGNGFGPAYLQAYY